jgi:hypothetical protein
MSLTITIDRTDEGLFRAEVSDRERTVIERANLRELAEELKQKIDLITVAPDGLLAFQITGSRQDNEAVARGAVESTALRREELDKLIEKYPVPSDWGEEPGWTDG